jgi:hypothetical protein
VTLRELLEQTAADLADVEVSRAPDGATTWASAGHPFAILSVDGLTAEFGLDGPVAAAATRTPDVVASPRGAGWVTFQPSLLDDHAADRAVAWLASAHRRTSRD